MCWLCSCLQSLTAELIDLSKQKVQVQREFEAFKDMAMQVGTPALIARPPRVPSGTVMCWKRRFSDHPVCLPFAHQAP